MAPGDVAHRPVAHLTRPATGVARSGESFPPISTVAGAAIEFRGGTLSPVAAELGGEPRPVRSTDRLGFQMMRIRTVTVPECEIPFHRVTVLVIESTRRTRPSGASRANR